MIELVAIFILILVNGILAGAEIAVLSIRKSRLQQLADERRHGAKALLQLRSSPERFLATVQIGISLVGATAAAFGGASLSDDVALVLTSNFGLSPETADSIALAVVVAVVSFASIIFGELVPKSLALHISERYALFVARPMGLLAHAFRPLVWLLTGVSNLFLKPFGDRTHFTETRLSPGELQQLMQEAATAGALDAQATEFASRALDLTDLAVSAVMIPRNRVVGVRLGESAQAAMALARSTLHTTLPLYDGTLDHIVGLIHTRDIFAACLDGGIPDLKALARPAEFVPESQLASHVLKHMQAHRTRMAIVVDEHGGVAGLVTIEDIVEEIVGDILSEHERAPASIQRDGDSYVVPGNTPLHDLSRVVGIDLDLETDYTTIAGLCMELAARIPKTGAVLVGPSGTQIEILDATPNQVRLVRITAPALAGSAVNIAD